MENTLKVQLYDAFTTLVYTIILADGVVDEKERALFKKLQSLHPNAKQPGWKFDTANAKEMSMIEAYKDAFDIIKNIGGNEDTLQLVDILEEISKVSKTSDDDDESLVESFLEKFRSKI